VTYIHYFLHMQTSKRHTNTLWFSGLQAGCSTSTLFMLCAVQQYQYAIHAVCCTAVPVRYSRCVLYSSTSTLFTLCVVQQYQYATHAVCCTAVPIRSSCCVLYSSTSTLFMLCAVQQYQYAIHAVCCTAVPVRYSCCVLYSSNYCTFFTVIMFVSMYFYQAHSWLFFSFTYRCLSASCTHSEWVKWLHK